jgi:hypothetical protein
MELITSLKFYNSITNELMVALMLFKSEIGYQVLSSSSNQIKGTEWISYEDAINNFNEWSNDIRKYYQSQQIIFNTK